jgi:acetylglutamate kinase
MTAPVSTSQAVLNAAGAARSLAAKPVVVKLGGSAMEEPTATRGTLECVAALNLLRVRVVVVHGGGKPIDRAMAAAGIEPRKVQGRRYTDDATLEIVVRVLHEINASLVEQFGATGARGAAFSELDLGDPTEAFPLRGERLRLMGEDGTAIDLGRVGKVTDVWDDELSETLYDGEVCFLPSLAVDSDGGWLNVNADTVASAVAGALNSEHCLFLTDTPGVLADRDNPLSLFPRLTEAECRDLIASGTIAGGMIPKVEACFDALKAGASRAVILDGRRPHALMEWALGEPAGTTIVSR